MSDKWDQNYSRLPMGASRNDMIVGETEWGEPIYATATGRQYWFGGDPWAEKPQPSRTTRDVFRTDDQGRTYRDYEDARRPQGSEVLNALAGIPAGLWGSIDAGVNGGATNGDIWNVAGMVQLGAGAMPAPSNALRSGSLRTADGVEDYIRRSRLPDTPDNGIGYSMFARGTPDPELDDLASYGPYGWTTTDAGAVPVEDIQTDIVRAIRSRGLQNDYQSSAAQLARDANPQNIVDSAGMWDAPDLVQAVWDDVLDPRGITKVKTADGLLLFDPTQARRFLSVGGVGAGGALVGNALARPTEVGAADIREWLAGLE